MTYGVKRVNIVVYMLAYGLPFVLVLFNFALTILYLDELQEPNNPDGMLYFKIHKLQKGLL